MHFMEVKNWTYEEYPEYHTDIKDALVLDTTGDEILTTYYPDIPYANMDGHVLTLQIISCTTRNEPNKKYPILLYVQGSHWDKQDVYKNVGNLASYAKQGYVCAIVQYRGYDIAPFPATIIDTRNAIRFMRKHAKEYNGDGSKIILAGNSSGGHAACYAPIYTGNDENQYPGISCEVAGIVDFYGSVSVMADDSNPTTINHCLADSPEGLEMGKVNLRENRDLREKLSVACQISEATNIPPVLIFHGTKDRTVNPSCSAQLYKQLKACGKQAYIVFLRKADHGGGEFWSKPVIQIMDRFIKDILK